MCRGANGETSFICQRLKLLAKEVERKYDELRAQLIKPCISDSGVLLIPQIFITCCACACYARYQRSVDRAYGFSQKYQISLDNSRILAQKTVNQQ